LTSALDGGEWSASRPGRFTPTERAPGTHWIEGWVGSRAVLEAVAKRKIPSPAGNRTLEPRSSSPQPSAMPTTVSNVVSSTGHAQITLWFRVLDKLSFRSSTNRGILPMNKPKAVHRNYNSPFFDPLVRLYFHTFTIHFINICFNIINPAMLFFTQENLEATFSISCIPVCYQFHPSHPTCTLRVRGER
jgi:hypothetical protein